MLDPSIMEYGGSARAVHLLRKYRMVAVLLEADRLHAAEPAGLE